MRPAARLQVDALDFDGAKNAFAIHLFADPAPGEVFGSAVGHGDSAIFGNDLVGGALGAFQNFFGRLRAAEVDGANFRAKMKRDRWAAEALLKHGGK